MSRGLNIVRSDSVICSPEGYEAASPVALRLSLDVRSSVERIIRENEREPETLLGVPLVSAVCENGGHICFALTDDAYTAVMRRIIQETPMPPAVEVGDDAAYAYMRARMYEERFFAGVVRCPSDESVKRALWRCMGLCQSELRPSELRLRLSAAACAVLGAARALPYSRRLITLRGSGDFAACAARLLYYAIQQIGG